MAGKYDQLDRDTLVRLLERRDAERQLGLVWERDELETDNAVNDDYVALDLDPQLSHGEGPWPNLVIEGDNYDALRALRATHKGRIRCIYIDPPYNTGNRDFVYNDRFVDRTHRFRHSLWLEFMYKRLVLARELLADDGVIFVSIDDNEVFRLGMLMEQVFGGRNFVGMCTWERKRKGSHLSRKLTKKTEYVLIASRCGEEIELFGEKSGEDEDQPLIKKTNQISRLVFPANSITAKLQDGTYAAGTYGVGASAVRLLNDATCNNGVISNQTEFEGRFIWQQSNLDAEYKSGAKFIVKTEKFSIRALKGKENQGFKALSSLITKDIGTNESASDELAELMGVSVENIPIDYPKPSSLILLLLRSCLHNRPDAVALDFFAGSGTTAHAVAKLNAEDGGNRRFILVSNTEANEEQPDKNLCRDVCAERVRRVMTGYTNAKGEKVDGLGGTFAYLRTRRVPRHRLNQKLAHGEIWNALELTHGQELSGWGGAGFAARFIGQDALAYLADFSTASVDALLSFVREHPAARTTVYSWSPDRARDLAPEAQHQPIPQFLRDRFA